MRLPIELQRWIDRQLMVPAELWWLRVAAVVAMLVVAFAVEGSVAGAAAWFVTLTMVLAVASALAPDFPAGSLLLVIVVWRWLATVDDPVAWPVVFVAVGLHVHHSALALLAAVPDTTVLPRAVLMRWMLRSAVAIVAGIGTWVLVVVFDRRSFGGSAVLTAASLMIVAVGAVALAMAAVRSDTSADGTTR